MNEKDRLKLLKKYKLKSISREFFENFYIINDEFFNHGILMSYKFLFFWTKYKILFPCIYSDVHIWEKKKLIVIVKKENKYSSFYYFNLKGTKIAELNNVVNVRDDKFDNVFFNRIIHDNYRVGVLDNVFNIKIDACYKNLNGLAPFIYKAQTENDLYGIINFDNEVILDFSFIEIFDYSYNNKVIVKNSLKKYFIFDFKDKTLNELSFQKIFCSPVSLHLIPDEEIKSTFKSIVEIVSTKDSFNIMTRYIGKWGIISADGKVVIPNEYDFIDFLSPKYLKVAKGIFTTKKDQNFNNIKWGVIDLDNNIIVPIVFDWVEQIEDEIWMVKKGGEICTGEDWDSDTWYSNGGKCGAYNKNGLIIPIEYDRFLINFGRVKDYIFAQNINYENEWFDDSGNYEVFDLFGNKILREKPLWRDYLYQGKKHSYS
ncbi:MAG: WG repeat-containing protein [Flavobacterium sp.]|nr:WG repeat-containing protein [Flavobacterium sp.]